MSAHEPQEERQLHTCIPGLQDHTHV